MRPVDGLHELPDDLRAGRVGQLGELFQRFVGRAPRARSLARRTDQNRPFNGRFDCDQFFADNCSLVILSAARDLLVLEADRSLRSR
jgi:hypothetical protein